MKEMDVSILTCGNRIWEVEYWF